MINAPVFYKDHLAEIRSQINRLRRDERRVISMFRKNCSHINVKRIAKFLPMPVTAHHYDVFDLASDVVRYKVVCEDCGKVLQK